MNTNLLVGINAVLDRISRSYSHLPAIFFLFFVLIGYHANADDQIIIKITDPAPVCFPQTVDLTAPSITAGSTVGLVFTYYSDPALQHVIPNSTAVGAGVYYVLGEIPAPGYGQASFYITVRVNTLPTATISYAGTPFCSDDSSLQPVTLNGTGSFTGGTFSGTSGLSIQPSTGAIIPSTSTSGTHTITYTMAASGGCPAAVATTSISILQPPVAANAGAAQSLCNVNSTTLEGNSPAGDTGIWTNVSGPNIPVFANSALNNTSVTGLITGVYVFRWTISNGTCSPTSSTVTVTNSLPPTISNAGPAQNLCNVTGVTMNANLPATGTGTWTKVSGPNNPVFANASLYNTAITDLVPGTYVFEWSISNGSCTPSVSNVTIENASPPDPSNAGPAQNICNVTSTVMAANIPVNGTGLWKVISGPNIPVFTNPSLGNTAVTGLITGVYVFQWSITDGTCAPSESTVTVTISDAPTISNAGLAQSLCNVTSTALTGNIPSVGTGSWTIISGPNNPTFTDASSATTSVTGLLTGVYVFEWRISNGNCTSSSNVTITNSSPPTISNAGLNQNLCESPDVTLAGNLPVSGTGNWTMVSGPNSPAISDASIYNTGVTGLIPGVYIFRWSISNGSCPTSSSTVTITNSASPVISNAGPVQNLCNATGTILAGNVPTVGLGTWSVISGPNTPVFANAFLNNTGVTGLIPGLYVFQWKISNGICSSTSTVNVINSTLPSTSVTGPAQNICGSLVSGTLGGNTPTEGTGTWSIVSGGTGSFSASGSGNAIFNADNYGIYLLRWTISNGSCISSTSDITLNFSPSPSTATVGEAQNLCGTLVSAPLGGNIPGVGNGQWSIVSGGTGNFSAPGSGSSDFTANTYGTYVLRWSINSNTCISYADINVGFFEAPSIPVVGAEQNMCGTLVSAGLGGNVPAKGTGIWSIVSGGTGNFSIPENGNSTFTADGYGKYILGWTISNGTCVASTANVAVNYYQAPTATVGPAQKICNKLVSENLGGNTPIVGSGSWSILSGGTGTFSDARNGASTFTGSTIGTYILRWTITNGTCTPGSADISVDFFQNNMSVSFTGSNASKAGAADGTIDATVTGGIVPFNYSWTDSGSFTATTEDLTGLKFGKYTLNVTDLNGCSVSNSFIVLDPPHATDDEANTIEDSPVTFNAVINDTDADGTIATSTVDLDPSTAGLQTSYIVTGKGAFTVSATGDVTFTPLLHFVGIAVIQYVVNDNSGLLSNTANITVNVKYRNKPPVAVDDMISIAEDNTAKGNLFDNDNDPEGKALTLESFTIGSTIYTPGTNATIKDVGTLQINLNGTFVFVPLENYNGIVPQVIYKLADDEGLTATANLNIQVTPVNDPPSAVADLFNTKENTKLEANVLSNDFDIERDGITLDLIPVQAPSYGTLVLSANGDFTYQPVIDFMGSDSFTYQICDNGNPVLCSIGKVTIVVKKDENCEVFVPNVFTPNADGVHDYFKIRCLYNYENAEMQIFNRAGNLIFKKDHYGNLDFWGSEDQAFWNGRSENKLDLMSDELPVGTYYYVLKLGDGKVLTGFIFLGK